MRKLLVGLLALAASACTPAEAPETGGRVASSGGTLLVGNKAENTVSFIALADGRELGRAATGPMPHEIAISPDGRQAAVVSYGGQSIDVFDVTSRAKLRTIDLGTNRGPHGIVWLEDGRLIVTTERSQSVAVVDTRRGDRVTTIPTGQQGTHMVVVSTDRRRAYTANIGAGTVSVIDLVAGRKLRDIAVGGRPEGIALTPDGREVWVGDLAAPRVQAFDTQTFERLAEIRTGPIPIRVVASPDGRWMVTSNVGDGSMTVIDARTRLPRRQIAVGGEESRQVTILFSADGRRLYAAETGRNQVAEVDFASGRVLRRFQAGSQGDGLAIAP
jgi:YVTN family beta-propeller protein